MKIAKEFHWEMGHRLPHHNGKCKNIHGHSYRLLLELDGDIKADGMVMDYYFVKQIVKPVIEDLDHCFMVSENDDVVLEFLNKIDSKRVVVPFHSTVENISLYLLNRLKDEFIPYGIKKIKVKIFETYDDFAEAEISL